MALVIEYHEELELDLRDQQVDLLDFWRGTITPRLLELLIRNLPATSRFARTVDPDTAEIVAWGPGEYIAAATYDALVVGQRLKTKLGNSVPPYPRPADAILERREREERMAALEEQAERNRLRDQSST